VLVMLHVPWYCSNFVHIGEGLLMRESMEPLLYKYGVDIVLTGTFTRTSALSRYIRMRRIRVARCTSISAICASRSSATATSLVFLASPAALVAFQNSTMNGFRLVGDMLHLLSFFIILWQILTKRGVAGLSFKSQLLYTLVFATRYLDLPLTLYSPYLTVMKLVFLASSGWILYLIRVRFRSSYDALGDSTNLVHLVLPCVGLTVIQQLYVGASHFPVLDAAWVFSEFLEAVAILPQLWMLQRTGSSETLTVHYLAALGGYRFFYVLNWGYRYLVEGRRNWVSWIAGGVQTLLYSDFFYYYFRIVVLKKRETII